MTRIIPSDVNVSQVSSILFLQISPASYSWNENRMLQHYALVNKHFSCLFSILSVPWTVTC
jgi:hypothetical protein